jgi:hypothetical protein
VLVLFPHHHRQLLLVVEHLDLMSNLTLDILLRENLLHHHLKDILVDLVTVTQQNPIAHQYLQVIQLIMHILLKTMP